MQGHMKPFKLLISMKHLLEIKTLNNVFQRTKYIVLKKKDDFKVISIFENSLLQNLF